MSTPTINALGLTLAWGGGYGGGFRRPFAWGELSPEAAMRITKTINTTISALDWGVYMGAHAQSWEPRKGLIALDGQPT